MDEQSLDSICKNVAEILKTLALYQSAGMKSTFTVFVLQALAREMEDLAKAIRVNRAREADIMAAMKGEAEP